MTIENLRIESYRILKIFNTSEGVEQWLVEYYNYPDPPKFLYPKTNEFMGTGNVQDYYFSTGVEAVGYLRKYLITH